MEYENEIAAVLEKLEKTPQGESHSAAIYFGLGETGMAAYTELMERMESEGLIYRTPAVTRILQKGRDLAAKIREARESERIYGEHC